MTIPTTAPSSGFEDGRPAHTLRDEVVEQWTSAILRHRRLPVERGVEPNPPGNLRTRIGAVARDGYQLFTRGAKSGGRCTNHAP